MLVVGKDTPIGTVQKVLQLFALIKPNNDYTLFDIDKELEVR